MILIIANTFFIIYLAARLILPLRMSIRSRIVLCLLLVLASFKSYAHFIYGGTFFNPDMPNNLYFFFDISRAIIVFLCFLVILRDLINLIVFAIGFIFKKQSLQLFKTNSLFSALILLTLAFAFSIYGTVNAYTVPEVFTYKIKLDKTDALKGYKIALLADIHVSKQSSIETTRQIVTRVNQQQADLILIAGDIVDGSVAQRGEHAKELFNLKANDGVYYVPGNHEFYSGYTQWQKFFTKHFKELYNSSTKIVDKNGNTLFNLAGITDKNAPRFGFKGVNINQALANIDTNYATIMLSHQPIEARAIDSSNKVDLILSGHTHGGMIKGFDQIVASANDGFVSGLYQLTKAKLIVSNGTMLWMGIPLRLFVPSQIVIIEFV